MGLGKVQASFSLPSEGFPTFPHGAKEFSAEQGKAVLHSLGVRELPSRQVEWVLFPSPFSPRWEGVLFYIWYKPLLALLQQAALLLPAWKRTGGLNEAYIFPSSV